MLRWKLKRGIGICVLIQNDSERIRIAKARLYEADWAVRREWGTERKGGEDVRCEDVTKTLLRTDALTEERLYTPDAFTQRLLHSEVFHTRAFTHKRLYTQTPSTRKHTRFYAYVFTQTLLHTDAFIHRHLLDTGTVRHKRIYTQTRLRTRLSLLRGALTHR